MAAQKEDSYESSQSATQERESEINSSMGSVGAFDNSPLHLTVEKLNGKNYKEWAQTIKLVIDGKGKLGLLTNKIRHWQNVYVSPDDKGCVRCDTGNILRCQKCFPNLRTQDTALADEARRLGSDSVQFKKKMENERVFEFLMGLNCKLDDVRSRVLSRQPLPSIREDLSSRKTIGSAKERERLYYFDEANGESMSEARPLLTLDYLNIVVFKSTPCLISTPSPNTEGHLNSGGDTEIQTNKETLVYSRRPKSKSNETLTFEALKEKQPRSCTLHHISKFVSYNALSTKCHAFTTHLDRIQIPKNIQEVLEIPEWREAVMEEIRALEKNRTWEVMTLPRGKKPVGYKWVFTVKYKADDTVERYKTRLVAKGFTQTYDIDYTETFAPVAKLNTIRVLLSLAANLDGPLHQFDIKNAFLNGELEEEVFMTLPPWFCKEEEETRVCKLKKSLYGVKQSPRAWFDRFEKVIKNQGYQ
ncbi:Retrovirus-related Pol polyprotein from transposon TNT 1-94 [Vitis vinifera]|uniref:Retrovirus-related Pol polyprotein from transposon TNT 1-94 n=1 Tax=Vitis vinifera TaxID=29760 RepID=A0A438JQ18_VITVI|nr:Retrovirus-related Pol polyprotein from transposon TNT 1-94 [Vitis vinifera]